MVLRAVRFLLSSHSESEVKRCGWKPRCFLLAVCCALLTVRCSFWQVGCHVESLLHPSSLCLVVSSTPTTNEPSHLSTLESASPCVFLGPHCSLPGSESVGCTNFGKTGCKLVASGLALLYLHTGSSWAACISQAYREGVSGGAWQTSCHLLSEGDR